jgi:hypothetical protein
MAHNNRNIKFHSKGGDLTMACKGKKKKGCK